MKYEVLGDIEGNLERFLNYINKSENLYFEDGNLHIQEGTTLIFIGDSIDKGPGSIRILDTLNSLKKRYPNQYIQIAGNRDINKMRIPNELSDTAMEKAPRILGVNDEQERWLLYQEWLNGRVDNKPNRLKHILEKTMGAGKAFENRKHEMALLKEIDLNSITDQMVLDSFLDDFKINGRMRTYIKNSQMLYLTNDNTLAAHGFVGEENFGYIPFSKNERKKIPQNINELKTWIEQVNQNTHRLIKSWETELDNGNLKSDSEWMDLVRFQEPTGHTGKNPRSFIYGRYSDKNGNPQLPREEFLKNAKQAGLKRTIVGHTPTGDYPVILKDQKTGFQIALVDTSFSKDEAAQIIINDKGIKIKGSIDAIGEIITTGDPFIGLKTIDDSHVIGKEVNTGEYILHKVSTINDRPFTSSYEKVDSEKLISMLNELSCAQAFL